VQTQTIDYDPDIFLKSRQSEADKGLLVKFLVRPFKDEAASLAEGRPIFKDREYVDIRAPGDRLGGVCRPAEMKDIQRFPEHYRLFKTRTSEQPLQGTPLSEWPLITRSQAEELAFMNVKTVEQLAAMSDGLSGKMMNFHSMKRKANEWLEVSKDNAAAMQLKEELHKRDQEIELLKQQLAALALQVNSPAQPAEANDELAELKAMVMQLAAAQQAAPAVPEKRKAGRPKVIKPTD